jgi:hypothetical protein
MQRVESNPDNREEFKHFIFGLGKGRSSSESSVNLDGRRRSDSGIKITTMFEVA